AFCTYLRTRLGVEVIRPDGAMAAARRVLAEGGSVAMPIDQVPDRAAHGVLVDFLGAPALVDRAPFVLAKRAGVPLLVIAAASGGSGAEIVTVALRRVDRADESSGSLMSLLQRKKWVLLPNTAGCFTADDAVRTLRLARELGIASMVKLEVIGDPRRSTPTTS